MIKMMSMGFLVFTILLILMVIFMIISKKKFMDREKASPFECGLDPINSPRIPFSLHFFLMAVIFLIFDVEIVIILPMTIIMNFLDIWEWYTTSFLIIMILTGGLYHEWAQGMLNWSY